MSPGSRWATGWACGAAVAVAAAAGCGGTMGAWLYWLGPPEVEVKSEYKLDPGRLAILIDDGKGWLADPAIRPLLTEELIKLFAEHNVNHLVVPAEDITRLRQRDPQFERRGVREIGRRLKADRVLHLNVRKFTLHDETVAPAYKGRFEIAVKVIDTSAEKAEDVRLWPSSGEGKVVEVTTELHTGKGESYNEQLTRRLCEEMADKIAKLFYDHKMPKPH